MNSPDMPMADVFRRLATFIVDEVHGSVHVGDVSLSVVTRDDHESDPTDDCHADSETMQRWRAGDWKFIAVKLIATIGEAQFTARLWGVEHGLVEPARERDHLAETILPSLYAEIEEAAQNAADAFTRLRSRAVDE